MLIAHLSDAHLGRRQYGLEERRDDYIAAFRSALSIIAEREVDLVLIAGDLFNDLNPQPAIYREVIEALKSLRKPVVVIGGNHDWRYTSPNSSPVQVVALLESVKFLKFGEFVDFNDVRVIGFSSIPKDLGHKVRRMVRRSLRSNGRNLLVVHQLVLGTPGAPVAEDAWTIGSEVLEGLDVDYIAGGHVHVHALKHPALPLWYSGSLEAWDLNDFEQWVYRGGKLDKVVDQADKGFLLVDLSSAPKVEPVVVPRRRRLIRVKMLYEALDPFKLRKDFEDLKAFDIDGAILRIELVGGLSGGYSVRDLEVHKLKRVFTRVLKIDVGLYLSKRVEERVERYRALSVRELTKEVLLRHLSGFENAEFAVSALLKAMDYLEEGDEEKALSLVRDVAFS